ncbi:hypothetical protein BDB00DRAFT_804506 [Zychaea mexicana]|uniref:uncharacterized protein n=1 Tax=Zychaea mexicana TaxID=64656 RepID=UPI0022FE5030|nr:uncharacterized protein BDB00DRAFT_804506 [Zychaea mexicana]KAI9497458.1 hypothetical protein BDB00DRAFT_804506 [Zychaea mexicana]
MKSALMKAGVNHVISTAPKPKPPGSDLEAHPQQKRKYFWQKKQDPYQFLTAHERKILHKVKSRAHTLDSGLNCCCCQIGLDPIIGLIPVIGDFAGLVLALYLVQTAAQVNLPQSIVSQMMMNIIVDFFIGIVPVVGDLMDVMYKANTRNAILLENYLNKQQLKRQQQGEAGAVGGSSSSHPQLDQHRPLLQDHSSAPPDPPASSSSAPPAYIQQQHQQKDKHKQQQSNNPHLY